VRDPEGNAVEVSAEIETITDGRAPGVWQHNERTLNLWGGAWIGEPLQPPVVPW